MYQLSLTSDAEDTLKHMCRKRRIVCMAALRLLLEDPCQIPARSLRRTGLGAEWLIPLAPSVITLYLVNEQSHLVTVDRIFDFDKKIDGE